MRGHVFFAIGVVLSVLQGPGAAQAPAPQQPSFRTATTLVEVDAIVRDRAGTFVTDLTPGDFELIEDGKPQAVEQLYVVLGSTAKMVASPTASPAPPALPLPPAPQIQRTFVLVFDDSHMEPAQFSRARDAALTFVQANLRRGDVGGIVVGAKMANNRLTSVREEIEAAIKAIKPSGESRSLLMDMREWPRLLSDYEVYLLDRRDKEALDRAETRACSDDPQACSSRKGSIPVDQILVEKAKRLLPAIRNSAMQTMRTIEAVASGLGKLPGRKTIVLLSDGFLTEESWSNVRQVVETAGRASVRIYSIDTRGLNRVGEGANIIDAGPRSGAAPVEAGLAFDTNADGPNSLAVDTGGLVIRNRNNFAAALDQIAADASSYYVIGYRPANEKLDGKFHEITVRVKRPGMTVRARKGYVATPASNALLTTGAAAAGPPSNAAGAAATPDAAWPPAGASSTLIGEPTAGVAATAVPASAVRLRPGTEDRVAALEKMTPDPLPATAREEARALARTGWEAYQKGDLESARQALRAATATAAAPAWVHYALGWTEYGLRGYARAVAEWEQVREAVPQFEAVYFDLADGYLQQKNPARALETMQRAVERWPNDVEVYNAVGTIEAGRGALGEAIRTFEKAVALDPSNATACYNLAKASELQYVQTQRLRTTTHSIPSRPKDRERAIEYYRRTIALGKQFVEEAREGLRRMGAL